MGDEAKMDGVRERSEHEDATAIGAGNAPTRPRWREFRKNARLTGCANRTLRATASPLRNVGTRGPSSRARSRVQTQQR